MNQPQNAALAKSRIMMVDDHPIVREGLMRFLNTQPDLDACCEAGNIAEALHVVAQHAPALVIIDISLKEESGLSLIQTLRHKYSSLGLLAMSQHDESVFAERALRAGANGYLMKQSATSHILLAVRQVLAGHVYLSAAMQSRLSQQLLSGQRGNASSSGSSAQPGLLASLSEREFEVLHLLGLGFSTRQIAEQLKRSIKTIESHRASLKDKLKLDSGTELTHFAFQMAAQIGPATPNT